MLEHFHDKFKLIHVTQPCISSFTLEVWRLFHKKKCRITELPGSFTLTRASTVVPEEHCANMSSYQTRGALDARSELVAPTGDVQSVVQAHTDTTI